MNADGLPYTQQISALIFFSIFVLEVANVTTFIHVAMVIMERNSSTLQDENIHGIQF